jgi:hypothetical protein
MVASMSLMMSRLQESLGVFAQGALTFKGISLGVVFLFVAMNVKGLPGVWHVSVGLAVEWCLRLFNLKYDDI